MKSSRFIIAVLLFLLFSCEGDYQITYRWNGMSIQNADNSSKYPEASSADSIAAATYCLQLDMDTEELSRKGRYLDSETRPININPLDSLSISSDLDFNSDYIAGANLADHFIILNESYFFSIPANSFGSYPISNVHGESFYDEPNVKTIHLLLSNKPDVLGSRKFKVDFFLKDGTIYKDSLTVNLY